MTLATVTRGMYIMEFTLRPAIKKRTADPLAADAFMRQMWALSTTGMYPPDNNE